MLYLSFMYVWYVKVHAAVYDVLFNFNFMLSGCEEVCIAGVAVAVSAGIGGILIVIVIVIICKKKKGQGINMLYYVYAHVYVRMSDRIKNKEIRTKKRNCRKNACIHVT